MESGGPKSTACKVVKRVRGHQSSQMRVRSIRTLGGATRQAQRASKPWGGTRYGHTSPSHSTSTGSRQLTIFGNNVFCWIIPLHGRTRSRVAYLAGLLSIKFADTVCATCKFRLEQYSCDRSPTSQSCLPGTAPLPVSWTLYTSVPRHP